MELVLRRKHEAFEAARAHLLQERLVVSRLHERGEERVLRDHARLLEDLADLLDAPPLRDHDVARGRFPAGDAVDDYDNRRARVELVVAGFERVLHAAQPDHDLEKPAAADHALPL